MLTDRKREFFRKMLNQRLDALSEERMKNAVDARGFDDRSPDPSDRATVDYERDFCLRMLERDRGLFLKIQEALARIESGTYGICEECEEEISEQRLTARPVTTLCIECKKRQEAREKIKGA
jgi:DnaK suppressor protein